jgi:hypothetical protein
MLYKLEVNEFHMADISNDNKILSYKKYKSNKSIVLKISNEEKFFKTRIDNCDFIEEFFIKILIDGQIGWINKKNLRKI